MSTTDLDRSLDRLLRGEDQRAKLGGFGITKQGRAIARKYRERLADIIEVNRAQARDKAVWKTLRGVSIDDLALRLLIAGISVCATQGLGNDSDGHPNLLKQSLWIGRQLGCDERKL